MFSSSRTPKRRKKSFAFIFSGLHAPSVINDKLKRTTRREVKIRMKTRKAREGRKQFLPNTQKLLLSQMESPLIDLPTTWRTCLRCVPMAQRNSLGGKIMPKVIKTICDSFHFAPISFFVVSAQQTE